MIADACVPPGHGPLPDDEGRSAGRWTATQIERLAGHLAANGPAALGSLDGERLAAAWDRTVGELADPRSPARRELAAGLPAAAGLSAPALDAALEAMLGGFHGEPAHRLLARGFECPRHGNGLAVAILAGNVPGLAVQVVLPALAAGRPLLVKSPSAEPFFAAALVERLRAAEPTLGDALAAVTWPGGDRAIEAAALSHAGIAIAFGDGATLDDLRPRVRGRFVELGPKLSIAVVSRDTDPQHVGLRLATDVALFEQRGCLSLQVVFTDGDPLALAGGIEAGLDELARRWPPPPLDAATAGALRQLRQLTLLEGGSVKDRPLADGSVLVAPRPAATDWALQPVPGRRTVRVQALDELAELPRLLAPWHGLLQGAVLAGEAAAGLAEPLSRLGVTRLAAPGRLQYPDALWANGERHLLDRLLVAAEGGAAG